MKVIRKSQEQPKRKKKLPIREVCPNCHAMLEIDSKDLILRSKETEEGHLEPYYQYTCPCCKTTQRV